MTDRFKDLLDRLTPQEQAELEAFAAFLVARRTLQPSRLTTDDISSQELMDLVAHSGALDWLADEEEDRYTPADGETAAWPTS
jgi:hypothetical protein